MDSDGINSEVLLMSITRQDLAKLDAQIKSERAVLREEIRTAGQLYQEYLERMAMKYGGRSDAMVST